VSDSLQTGQICWLVVLEIALPPFLVENLHTPAWGFSLLFTLNSIMVEGYS
jgi:hypothetical protein